MSTTRCPACGHLSTSSEPDQSRPDPGVVRWFTESGGGLVGDLHVSEVYQGYLRSCTEAPVSRRRFTADLEHLGVEADDDGNLAFG